MNSTQKQASGWKRRLGRGLIWISGIVGVCVTALWVIALVFEKDVEAWFLNKLNQELNTRVEIKELSFSLIRNFPSASVSLEEVSAEHSRPYKGAGKLIQAEHIDFSFSIWDLLSGSYRIEEISAHNGSIQILRDADGVVNYDLLKPRKQAAQNNEKFSFSLQQVRLRNMDIRVNDQPSRFKLDVKMDKCRFSGNFTEKTYDLKVDGEMMAHQVKSGKLILLEERPVDLELDLLVDEPNRKYVIRKSLITLSSMDITVAGIYKDLEIPYIDMEAEGEALDIESFLSLLPPGYDEQIKHYRSEGEMYARCRMKGQVSSNISPAIRVDFGLKNAKIENKEAEISLDQVNLTGRYENRNNGYLQLKDVGLVLNGGELKGSADIRNFDNPSFSISADARLNLADVNRFTPTGVVKNLSGEANLKLTMQADAGSVKSFSEGGYDRIKANGYLNVRNAGFRIEGDTLAYSGFSGDLRFENNLVKVEQMQGMAGNTDFKLKGSLRNLFAWMFGEHEGIGIEAAVESRNVFLDELFERKTKASGSNEAYAFRISPRLKLKVQARVGKLQFRKFQASAIRGVFSVANEQLVAHELVFQTMKGSVRMNGKAESNGNDKLMLSCMAKLARVDINRLFYECENFGQDVMREENIGGLVDATIDFQAIATSSLKIDPDLVYSKADLVINQGQLIRFEPLEALSKFIALDELRHVRFSQLKNTIEIRNSKIIIPQMDISSNAISISASGVHSFDNLVEYHLRLLLSDLLAKKARKARKDVEEFGVVEDDGLGRTSLFLAMRGPVSNPTITYDSRGARDKIKNDLVTEKQTMKQLLREEFGLFKKDTSLTKKSGDGVKKSNKVIISFDEEEEEESSE